MSGLMGDRALISVDGAAPRVVRVGERVGGVEVVAVSAGSVEVAVGNRRYALAIGQGVCAAPASRAARAVLTADGRGHYLADGQVNGQPVRFMVDTGASLVALPASVARRAGVSLEQATPVLINTANGQARAQRVVINHLRLGDIGLHLVPALVVEDSALSQALLGMSFLNRTRMQQEGETLVLTLRY